MQTLGCVIVLALMAPKTKIKRARAAKAKQSKRAKRPLAAKTVRRAGIDPKRVQAILAKLDEAYPIATCELKHENPFQLLISTILSAQCTDTRVNEVTKTLYVRYPTPEAFAYATPKDLEQEIRPTGFFRNKTKSIIGASKAIVETFGGKVPRTMEELLTLPGVARKTANVVLGTAAPGEAAGSLPQRRSEKDRARFDAGDSEGQMDFVLPPVDLARPARLPSAQTEVRGMQSGITLLLER